MSETKRTYMVSNEYFLIELFVEIGGLSLFCFMLGQVFVSSYSAV
jgi:hypothetical protein